MDDIKQYPDWLVPDQLEYTIIMTHPSQVTDRTGWHVFKFGNDAGEMVEGVVARVLLPDEELPAGAYYDNYGSIDHFVFAVYNLTGKPPVHASFALNLLLESLCEELFPEDFDEE